MGFKEASSVLIPDSWLQWWIGGTLGVRFKDIAPIFRRDNWLQKWMEETQRVEVREIGQNIKVESLV